MLKIRLLQLFIVLFFLPAFMQARHFSKLQQKLKKTTNELFVKEKSPSDSNKLLFYIEQNKNKNTVFYDVNKLADGKINPKKPVVVYWKNFATDGKKEELSYFEWKMAYGFDFKVNKAKNNSFVLFLKSIKRDVQVYIDADRQAKCVMKIKGKMAYLNKIFVQATQTMFLPQVEYLGVYGTELISGKQIYEKILP